MPFAWALLLYVCAAAEAQWAPAGFDGLAPFSPHDDDAGGASELVDDMPDEGGADGRYAFPRGRRVPGFTPDVPGLLFDFTTPALYGGARDDDARHGPPHGFTAPSQLRAYEFGSNGELRDYAPPTIPRSPSAPFGAPPARHYQALASQQRPWFAGAAAPGQTQPFNGGAPFQGGRWAERGFGRGAFGRGGFGWGAASRRLGLAPPQPPQPSQPSQPSQQRGAAYRVHVKGDGYGYHYAVQSNGGAPQPLNQRRAAAAILAVSQ